MMMMKKTTNKCAAKQTIDDLLIPLQEYAACGLTSCAVSPLPTQYLNLAGQDWSERACKYIVGERKQQRCCYFSLVDSK